MKMKIVEIHEEDQFYPERDKFIGKVFEGEVVDIRPDGWISAEIEVKPHFIWFFWKIRVNTFY